jgi:hypothetical protein
MDESQEFILTNPIPGVSQCYRSTHWQIVRIGSPPFSVDKKVAELQESFQNNNRLCLELLGSAADV